MSYRRVNSGGNFNLAIQLPIGDDAQFPLAYIYDSTGTPISGSPFALADVGGGLYTNDSVFAPDGQYEATYVVFTDSGHTTESTTYGRSNDNFDVYTPSGGGGGLVAGTGEAVVGTVATTELPVVGTVVEC